MPDVTTSGVLLYIDDSPANQLVMEALLEKRPGVKLLAAMRGRAGLALACAHQPQMILLDLHLPDMDGVDVLHALQAEPRTQAIPVVVISADVAPGYVERLKAAGARECLTKPFDVERLLAVVDETAKGQRA